MREFLEGLETPGLKGQLSYEVRVREFLEGLETIMYHKTMSCISQVREFLEGLETGGIRHVGLLGLGCESS